MQIDRGGRVENLLERPNTKENMQEFIWDETSPFSPTLEDLTPGAWGLVTHVRIGYDEFEWVRFLGRKGYTIKISPSSQGDKEVTPEDVYGLRFDYERVQKLSSRVDELLNTIDHATTKLTEARASKSLTAIALAAGRLSTLAGTLDQSAGALFGAIKWRDKWK